ncbi:hypothetical protein ENSA5_68390 [Enhygromyxa salina]|uniref:Uncharacterized protein n=1 Tax=Enhygromyxa salina TaxID=215803 RepID=A0A2S9XB22_9BACT|nr:hypothetical protein [Enhygromyxa salina]PRP90056.1 hypothetical protein ENSA5_68390 [Enhygromyxa salina]
MFEAQLFHVPTATLFKTLDTAAVRLAEEPETRVEAFRERAGLDLSRARERLVALTSRLRASVEAEAELLDGCVEVDAQVSPEVEPARAWLAQLHAAADRYVAEHGTDDIALTGRLRLGKQDPADLEQLRREMLILVPESSSLRDRLRDHGLSDDFISQGWAAYEALGGKRPAQVETLIALEDANLRRRRSEALTTAALCSLSAAEVLVCADEVRAPRKYELEGLRRARQRARAALQPAV